MDNIKNIKFSKQNLAANEESKIVKYANSSFFLKKDADAIAFLKKHPFPKELIRK